MSSGLERFERVEFSQTGEDGIIEHVFNTIGETNRFAVEFGAHDGLLCCNARHLFDQGWSGLLIEYEEQLARIATEAYADKPVKVVNAVVTPDNIGQIFLDAGVPEDLDYLSIDIDSYDLPVWRALSKYKPRLFQAEYNQSFVPPIEAEVPYDPANPYFHDGSDFFGASLQSFTKECKKRGYELIHCMTRGPNAFYVRKEDFEAFGIKDNSLVTMYREPVYGERKRHPLRRIPSHAPNGMGHMASPRWRGLVDLAALRNANRHWNRHHKQNAKPLTIKEVQALRQMYENKQR